MDRQKLLGIDYGDKRIGLALAEAGSIAVPYKVLQNSGRENTLKELQDIVRAEEINLIVIGLPHSLSGQTNERLETTQAFVDYLKNNLEFPIETVDEQLTSKLYENMGVDKEIDKHAATAILDTFLTQQNG